MTFLERAVATAPSVPRQAALTAFVAHARTVPSLQREAFAAELADLGEGPGHVLVHTCHRVELYVVPNALGGRLPTPPAGAEILDDVAAARHLITVACGLDSAVVGEAQILHQLRETIADRRGERALDPVLDRLFQAALHAGRAAHAWFTGSPRSLADVALDRIAERIRSLEGRRILVVGVGRMGRLAAFAAMRRGCDVIVSNRSPERARQLAEEVGGTSVPFGAIGGSGNGEAIGGAIVAISGQWTIDPRDAAQLASGGVPVVDLSSPPALGPALQTLLGTRFISVDELSDDEHGPSERLRRRLEDLISRTGRDYCQWIRTRSAVPAIQAVVDNAELHRQVEVDWLRRHLPTLSDEDLGMVDQMTHRLVAALLHAPLTALNEDPAGDLERAARALFDL